MAYRPPLGLLHPARKQGRLPRLRLNQGWGARGVEVGAGVEAGVEPGEICEFRRNLSISTVGVKSNDFRWKFIQNANSEKYEWNFAENFMGFR